MSTVDVRAIDEVDLCQTPRPATRHELAVFLAEEAFDRAVERGASDTTREIGGVLVGELLRDDRGPYLRIETTIDALHAEEKGAELTFTHATWEHIHKEMDTRHQGKRVVGWYHTHPGFGVFLSDRDQFIHKSFFNLPFQVAFVYDPKSKEHGLFSWRDNEVSRMRRYAIGAREHVWDGNRAPARPVEATEKQGDGNRSDDRAAAKDRGEEVGLGSLASVAIFAIVLALIAGFAGHWLGAQSGSSAILQARGEISRARSDGAQLAIGSLQNELVGVLRDTLGDQALHAPVERAIAELNASITSLEAAGPTPAAALATVPGATVASTRDAGSAAVALGGDPRLAPAISQLKSARDAFYRLRQDRGSAEATLAAIQQATRHGAELRADLIHDVAEQRAGVGALYAELAADVAKAGDKVRARRLLATAAHLDPGNRTRYEAQLQSFSNGATLPRNAVTAPAGVAPEPTRLPGPLLPALTGPTGPRPPVATGQGVEP